MGHEHKRDDWLGTTLRQSLPVASDACLDAETLGAWAEGGLTSEAAAAVDLHASNCARCMAVLAAMERTAPAAPARHAWTTARLVRWLVPLTAAATAVAIWIAVPDRAITPVMPPPTQELRTEQGRVPVPVPVPSPDSVPVPEPRTLGQNQESGARSPIPAPSTQNTERQAQFAQEQEQLQLRDESRRERAAPEESVAAPAAVKEATPLPPAAAPTAPPAVASDALAGAAATAVQRSALKADVSNESISPSNSLMRWRFIESASIERSTDGGKTWARTTLLPGVAPSNRFSSSDKSSTALSVVSIRAVDGNRAVVRTSDGTEFYTANGGRSWTRVQENSTAPF